MIFFTPIACTIIIDIFFYVTTMQIINRMNTYGRIHHKLKSRYGKFYEKIWSFDRLLIDWISCFQFHYVLTTVASYVRVVAVFDIILDRIRWFVIRTYYCQFRSSSVDTLHLCVTTKACQISVKENVLLQRTTISIGLGRWNVVYERWRLLRETKWFFFDEQDIPSMYKMNCRILVKTNCLPLNLMIILSKMTFFL